MSAVAGLGRADDPRFGETQLHIVLSGLLLAVVVLFMPDVARARDWLTRVGLDHLEAAEARDLSFGQQKLLELAAVLMAEPSLILLDEPAGGGNPRAGCSGSASPMCCRATASSVR